MCGKAAYDLRFSCYGESGQALLSAWKIRVDEKRSYLVDEKGVPSSFVDQSADIGFFLSSEGNAWVDTMIFFPEGHPLAGKASDDPPPTWNAYIADIFNPIVPKQVALDNIDFFTSICTDPVFWQKLYFAHTDNTDDQASSLSHAHRDGAFMVYLFHNGEDTEQMLELMFGDMDYDGNFPGFLGSNHLGPMAIGPVKSDWTKPCPTSWTWERRADECISPLEAVYGTQRLKRLEEIKAKVDPKKLFNCHTCIASPGEIPTPPPSGDNEGTPPPSGDNEGTPPPSGDNEGPSSSAVIRAVSVFSSALLPTFAGLVFLNLCVM
jgi:hypothetical protein